MSKKLNLFEAVLFGIGSIFGSGILFLPSVSYEISRNNVLLSWGLIFFICLPGIFFFKEMISKVNPDDGMAGIISLGLGKSLSSCVTNLILGTVIFGMPLSLIIIKDYVTSIYSPVWGYLSVFTIFLISYLSNLKKLKISSYFILGILIIFLLILVKLVFEIDFKFDDFERFKPNFNPSEAYGGAIAVFWAFAGFENLTFLYKDFKRPERNLILSILISVIFCFCIYFFVTSLYVMIVPYEQINSKLGLLQIALIMNNPLTSLSIILMAVALVQINFISWTSGVLNLLQRKSSDRRKNTFSLYSIFIFVFILIDLIKVDHIIIIKTVSLNFILIYTFALLSFLVVAESFFRKAISFFIIVFIILSLMEYHKYLLYPLTLITFSFIYYLYSFKLKYQDEMNSLDFKLFLKSAVYTILIISFLSMMFCISFVIKSNNVESLSFQDLLLILMIPITILSIMWMIWSKLFEKNIFDPFIEKLQVQELENNLVEVSRQVTHDIQSPLMVLEMVVNDYEGSDSESKDLALQAISRITEISKNLKDYSDRNRQNENIDISRVIQILINEKKMEYSHKNISIKFNNLINGDKFVNINETEIMRIISNLINNAVEASKNQSTIVEMVLETLNDKFMLSIQDFGSGFPLDLLNSKITKGLTIGKENGQGLGLFHADKYLKSIGGSIILSNNDKGALVQIIF